MTLIPLAFVKKPCVGCSRGRAWSIPGLADVVEMERIVQLTSPVQRLALSTLTMTRTSLNPVERPPFGLVSE